MTAYEESIPDGVELRERLVPDGAMRSARPFPLIPTRWLDS
jgi:hypothetical protein